MCLGSHLSCRGLGGLGDESARGFGELSRHGRAESFHNPLFRVSRSKRNVIGISCDRRRQLQSVASLPDMKCALKTWMRQ